MKTIQKLLIILFFLSLTSMLFAQTEQWNILVSGASSFELSGQSSKTKSDDGDGDPTKYFDFSFYPMAAIFVIDNLAVGLQLPSGVSRSKYTDDTKYVNTWITFAPLVRYYFLSDNIRPFGQISFGGGSDVDIYVDADGSKTKQKYGVLLLNAGGGVSLFISEKVAIDATLAYNLYRTKQKEDNTSNSRRVSNSIDFGIGVTVIL
jgi:hypothetical protein